MSDKGTNCEYEYIVTRRDHCSTFLREMKNVSVVCYVIKSLRAMYVLHMYNSKHSSILLYAYSTDSTRKIISVHINNSKTTPLDTMDIHIVNIFSKQTVRATDFS